MNNQNIEKMILTGLMAALVAVMTVAVAIPVPFTNGYIHPGDSMVFLSALILGWKRGAVAAGIGSAFADLFLGYVYWAPWTLVIKACMALAVGLIVEKCAGKTRRVVVACIALVVLWILFNAAVGGIMLYEAGHNAAALQEALREDVESVTALGVLLNRVQRQLMAAALLIPVALLAVTFFLRKAENIIVPLVQIIGMTGGGILMVFGYYVGGGLIYGSFAVAALSVPANIVQFVGGFLIASLLTAALKKTPIKKYFDRH
ncbi:MAG: ECF transporter S component [Clostridiales Family XIII bacterium]|jgi:uncharacterized membrane protein|nr:ECF transporter S component [Clostridiales Family XIII bacterium]